MSKFKEHIEECKEYLNVLEDIQDILNKNNIDFTSNASTEIIVHDKEKKEICNLIEALPIPKVVMHFIIDICQVKNNVYIRKKMK